MKFIKTKDFGYISSNSIDRLDITFGARSEALKALASRTDFSNDKSPSAQALLLMCTRWHVIAFSCDGDDEFLLGSFEEEEAAKKYLAELVSKLNGED